MASRRCRTPRKLVLALLVHALPSPRLYACGTPCISCPQTQAYVEANCWDDAIQIVSHPGQPRADGIGNLPAEYSTARARPQYQLGPDIKDGAWP